MKLSECKIGTIVIENLKQYNDKDNHVARIGWVSGLFLNSLKETIPIVIFAENRHIDNFIHNSLLDIYRD